MANQWLAPVLAFQQLFSASPVRNLAPSGDPTISTVDPLGADKESLTSGVKGRVAKWATLLLVILPIHHFHLVQFIEEAYTCLHI